MRGKFDLLSSNIVHFREQGKGKLYSVTPYFTKKNQNQTNKKPNPEKNLGNSDVLQGATSFSVSKVIFPRQSIKISGQWHRRKIVFEQIKSH